MSDELHWVVVDGTQPEWARCAAMDPAGNVYIPAARFGEEKAVFLAATFDAIPVVVSENHYYVPAWWTVQQYPAEEHVSFSKVVEQRVRKHCGWTPPENSGAEPQGA